MVTTKDADVGQTVSAGQRVMTVARTDVREAVVDLPESVAGALEKDARFVVVLQADGSVRGEGQVREIGPQADATTRTRRVRITLDRIVEAFRLGTTINATALAAGKAGEAIEIPVSALLEKDGTTKVWLVDEQAKTVRTVPVAVADRDDRFARVANGLSTGARVVVAGVNSLSEGQAVKLDEETPG